MKRKMLQSIVTERKRMTMVLLGAGFVIGVVVIAVIVSDSIRAGKTNTELDKLRADITEATADIPAIKSRQNTIDQGQTFNSLQLFNVEDSLDDLDERVNTAQSKANDADARARSAGGGVQVALDCCGYTPTPAPTAFPTTPSA